MTTVIAYIPALHQGYINFLEKYPDRLLVLDTNLIRETPRLERDIRALDPSSIVKMIKALDLVDSVSLLNTQVDVKHIATTDTIVMPDEDVSRNFARAHLADYKVTFVSTFLRWDRQISSTEFQIPAGRTVSIQRLDQDLLARAEIQAQKSPDWWRQVGTVISRDGKVLIEAHNRPFSSDNDNVNAFGDPRSNFDAGENIEATTAMHSEAYAISQAAKQGIKLEGASIYVTTFPCPVCAKSVAAAGITKVYYAKGYSLLDAEDILKAHNVELILVDIERPSTR